MIVRGSTSALAEQNRHTARPKILAVLPRGEAIRNFVYSETLDRIGKAADLHVMSVIPNVQIRDLLRERYCNVRPLDDTVDSWVARALHEVLDTAHGRWLWSEAASERWRRRNAEASTPGARAKLIAKRAVAYPFASRRGLTILDTALGWSFS